MAPSMAHNRSGTRVATLRARRVKQRVRHLRHHRAGHMRRPLLRVVSQRRSRHLWSNLCGQVFGTAPNQQLQARVHQLRCHLAPSLYRPVMPQMRPRRVGNQSPSLEGHLVIKVLHTTRHHRANPKAAQVS